MWIKKKIRHPLCTVKKIKGGKHIRRVAVEHIFVPIRNST